MCSNLNIFGINGKEILLERQWCNFYFCIIGVSQDMGKSMQRSHDALSGTLPNITILLRKVNKYVKMYTNLVIILVLMGRKFCKKANDVIIIYVSSIYLKIQEIV